MGHGHHAVRGIDRDVDRRHGGTSQSGGFVRAADCLAHRAGGHEEHTSGPLHDLFRPAPGVVMGRARADDRHQAAGQRRGPYRILRFVLRDDERRGVALGTRHRRPAPRPTQRRLKR